MGDPWARYDAWLEAPATDGRYDACDFCDDDEGCSQCDETLAAEAAAEDRAEAAAERARDSVFDGDCR